MKASGRVGVRVWKERFAVLYETQSLARVLAFDPLATLASGALLIVAEPRSATRIVHALRRNRIAAQIIGEVC